VNSVSELALTQFILTADYADSADANRRTALRCLLGNRGSL